MAKCYIVREIDGRLQYDSALLLKKGAGLDLINHEVRIRILKLLAREPMYPAEIARSLNMHEQKVYYHIKKLLQADILEVSEKKEIRGTTAKKLRPKELNYALSLTFRGKSIGKLHKEAVDARLESFLSPFMQQERLNAHIVVGSPDPHGPFKARARDGHYAVDLGIFLGRICSPSSDFAARLDVDTDIRRPENLILVGGPVTNLTTAKANEHLPARFSDSRPWGINGKSIYTDENVGMIARIRNPFHKTSFILVLAGIRFSGTKAAVIGLTRFHKLVLTRFTGQDDFCSIVQGYDMDGDGKVDSVELLE